MLVSISPFTNVNVREPWLSLGVVKVFEAQAHQPPPCALPFPFPLKPRPRAQLHRREKPGIQGEAGWFTLLYRL